MKGGSKLFIFAGVALALVAIVLGIASFSGGKSADATKSSAATKVTVVEALANIPAHTVLQTKDLEEKQIDASADTTGAVSSIASVVGKAYNQQLYAGGILLSANIETPGLSNSIDPNMRAIALPVDSVSAMSGLVQGDDYVDIIFHARISLTRVLASEAGLDVLDNGGYKNEDKIAPSVGTAEVPLAGDPGSTFVIQDSQGAQELVAKIMIQDVKVLRVVQAGQVVNADGSTGNSAKPASGTGSTGSGQLILQVTPQQAEVVNFISDPNYSYQVILRGKGDHTKVNTTGVTLTILASDDGLPWPQSVTSEDGTTVTVNEPEGAATPEAVGGNTVPLEQGNAIAEGTPEAGQ